MSEDLSPFPVAIARVLFFFVTEGALSRSDLVAMHSRPCNYIIMAKFILQHSGLRQNFQIFCCCCIQPSPRSICCGTPWLRSIPARWLRGAFIRCTPPCARSSRFSLSLSLWGGTESKRSLRGKTNCSDARQCTCQPGRFMGHI